MFVHYGNDRLYYHPNRIIRMIQAQRVRTIVSFMEIADSDAVLDAGCGEGYIFSRRGARRAELQREDTGAADAVREAATSAKRTARQARKVPGVARAEGQVKGAVASEPDLAIGRYDALTAEKIIGRLTGLSQVDLAKVAAYERKHEKRSTVLGRIDSLQGNEPWPGYDELTADEVRAVLANADDDRIEGGPRLRARRTRTAREC